MFALAVSGISRKLGEENAEKTVEERQGCSTDCIDRIIMMCCTNPDGSIFCVADHNPPRSC